MCPFVYPESPLATPFPWIGDTSPFLGPPVRPLGPELATTLPALEGSFCNTLVSDTRGLGLLLPSSNSAWERISSIRSVSRRVLLRPRKPPRWGRAYLESGNLVIWKELPASIELWTGLLYFLRNGQQHFGVGIGNVNGEAKKFPLLGLQQNFCSRKKELH